MNRSVRVMGLYLIAAILLAFAFPAHSQDTLSEFTRIRKIYIPGLVAHYNVAVVVDYSDASIDLERLGLTADVLEDQLGLTVIPTLGKAMRQDKTQRFDAVVIIGAALDDMTPDENAWLARFYRERGVVGFIDIPIVEQRAALKMDCEYQKINDYPWPWISVHMIENIRAFEDPNTGEQIQRHELLALPERCSPEWNILPMRLKRFAWHWVIVDGMNFRGGAYYAFSFVGFALRRAYGETE